MRNKILIGTLMALASTSSLAATATSTVAVQIDSQAITLANTQGLNFGVILPFGSSGTVTVSSAGLSTASNAYISNAASVTPSSWAVNGVPNAPYAITLPTSVTISSGTDTMTVTAFSRSGGTSQLALDAGGNSSFNVGARLNVGANQPAGVYNGTFDVTVNYN